ncbi:hypothetical protein ACQI4E_14575 [Streptomyces sp. CA-252508]|uniref:hypothetical protein n=1 Tax=Streptomyces sp. CA-252508 TaxID=3418946 RepID=UPI003D944009
MARRFRDHIHAQFATAPEPGTAVPAADKPPTAGLNLSALRNKDNAAKDAALAVLPTAGPEGTGASAIARALTDAHGTTRQTVVGWLKTGTDEGVAVRIGEGAKTPLHPPPPCAQRHHRLGVARAIMTLGRVR